MLPASNATLATAAGVDAEFVVANVYDAAEAIDRTAPEGWVTSTNLPSDAAIASFADDDSKMWIRVRSGVAVFPAAFSRGESFRITAFDAGGNQLGGYSETPEFPDDTNVEAIEIGDILGSIDTVDVDGNPVAIDGSGTTVLVYGASWCPPCDTVMTDVLPALEALGDDVTVYSISDTKEFNGSADLWPMSEDWPFTRLAPEAGVE